ncbi:MAG: DUF1015 domain-containing protein [Acidobacteriota bacterium]|nr:DUF1015 domain-containing protein [Blastocatellia bacterium]MDW8239597.1 DUF1015 domain-containing protein [Acidobacteriota bacterium]
MAKVFPFQAWRYNLTKVGDAAQVMTQPYDKISPEMQDRYYEHPYNLVRIILPKAYPDDDPRSNVYTRSLLTYRQWLAEGIFVQDEQPAFYVYYQHYRSPDGRERVRKGFIGLGQLEDYSAGIIYPHERTMMGPKLDRLKLLRLTRAHFESLFMLYRDPQHQIERLLDQHIEDKPALAVTDEYGVVHHLWAVTESSTLAQIQRLMDDKSLIIADGHHRYETALAYRNERREEGGTLGRWRSFHRAMMTFVNADSDGLTILPTHRVITSDVDFDLPRLLEFAKEHFTVEPVSSAEQLQSAMRNTSEQTVIGLYAAETNAFYLLRYLAQPGSLALLSDVSARQRHLDVSILHSLLLEHGLGIAPDDLAQRQLIRYVREFDVAIDMVKAGQGRACFFLRPTTIEQVCDVALAGEVLPQKSTDFYPKLLSGLTIYRID